MHFERVITRKKDGVDKKKDENEKSDNVYAIGGKPDVEILKQKHCISSPPDEKASGQLYEMVLKDEKEKIEIIRVKEDDPLRLDGKLAENILARKWFNEYPQDSR
jgi:hypothetical protein